MPICWWIKSSLTWTTGFNPIWTWIGTRIDPPPYHPVSVFEGTAPNLTRPYFALLFQNIQRKTHLLNTGIDCFSRWSVLLKLQNAKSLMLSSVFLTVAPKSAPQETRPFFPAGLSSSTGSYCSGIRQHNSKNSCISCRQPPLFKNCATTLASRR